MNVKNLLMQMRESGGERNVVEKRLMGIVGVQQLMLHRQSQHTLGRELPTLLFQRAVGKTWEGRQGMQLKPPLLGLETR